MASPVRVAARYLSAGQTLYHLTAKGRFKLDPRFAPADTAFALEDRSGRPGIYLASSVEHWVNGYGYLRPFVVEFDVNPSVKDDPGVHGRWGGELFVPASSYPKLKIKRVIPVDAYARETYGGHGWVEEANGEKFDTGEPIDPKGPAYPFHGWKYPGPDVRRMPSSAVNRLKRMTSKARRIR
jgi:hypothetical protein